MSIIGKEEKEESRSETSWQRKCPTGGGGTSAVDRPRGNVRFSAYDTE